MPLHLPSAAQEDPTAVNPHNNCIALTPPGRPNRRWRCYHCGAEGLFEQLMGANQSIPCTYVYPPCEACGGTPECTADCPLMAKLLGSPPPRVVVIGKPPKTRDA